MKLFRNIVVNPSGELVKTRQIFGFFIASILMLTVGFASISTTLRINGTGTLEGKYSIHFENYDANGVLATNTGYATSVAPVISEPKTELNNFSISFTAPGDKVEFKFKIANDGNINGEIDSITFNNGTITGENIPEGISSKITHELNYYGGKELEEGDVIGENETQVVTLTYFFDKNNELENANFSPALQISGLQLTIVYKQATKSITTVQEPIIDEPSGGEVVLTPTDVACFEFSNGTITAYYDDNPNLNCPTDVVIPSEINGVEVTTLGISSFHGLGETEDRITSVYIPYTVTTIESSTSFYDSVFGENYNLTVTIEDTLEHPSRLTTIGDYAFNASSTKLSQTGLSSITLPDTVTTIGYYAFKNNQITSIILPNSLDTIGSGAFTNNELTSATIPSVTTIGTYAFSQNNLTSVTLPNTLTTIGNYAFTKNKIRNLTLPSSLTSIGSYAFEYNTIRTLSIPASVTTISSYAFRYNNFFTKNDITIESDETNLANRFDSGWTTKGFPDKSLVVSGCYAIKLVSTAYTIYRYDDTCSTDIVIPTKHGTRNITKIYSNAFRNMNLTSAVIPSNITSIGQNAFADNPDLSTIVIKRESSSGVTLSSGWNGTAEVVYNPNYGE